MLFDAAAGPCAEPKVVDGCFRAKQERPPEEGIDFITEKFCEARYRGTAPTPDDRRKIDEILVRLGQVERAKP